MNDDESRVFSALQTVFNYEKFKNEVQKEATIAINKGLEDICISLPPGFGRSLCYELPAVLQNSKIVIVISPKLCSMKRHVEVLIDKRINARLLSLDTGLKEQKVVMKDLMSNRLTIKLLYATPEMSTTVYFRNLVHSLNHRKLLLYVVFDEAHCLSEQGHEYIPCYKKITKLNNVYGSVPRVAVATAITHEIMEDICQSLMLRSPRIFKVPVQLMNVYHDVWFLDILSDPYNHLEELIKEELGFLNIRMMYNGCAVVYCKEEATAETLRSSLARAGIPTLACHHKLNDGSRHEIESQWISGEAIAMVTTYDYEFIHRKPIKCKVYWAVPQNIPKYYRESVQSLTNDIRRRYCRIYFRSEEYSSTTSLIENQMEVVQYRGGNHAVGLLFLPVDAPRCRHAMISEYFGHVADPCKVNCDVCQERYRVETRALKFIAYSESVEQIKYDICDSSVDTEEEQSRSVKEKSPERAEEGAKKCSPPRGEISMDKNNNGTIVEYRDKQKSSSACTRPSTEGGYIQPCSSSTVKRAEDNSNATGANALVTACSLLAKYKLDNKISLEWCDSKSNAANISIRIDGTQISSGRSNTRTGTVEKEDRVTGNDSCEVIFVEPEKPNEPYANRDTCPAEFSSKRRNIETENEPSAVTRDRSGSRTSDRDDRVKDDANEIVSHAGSRIKCANSNTRTRTVEKEDRVTGNDFCEVIFVGPKKKTKRYANRDTCPAEFSSERRKIETENKPSAVTRDRSGSRTSDRDERVKDDANEIVLRGYATAEYLMDKFLDFCDNTRETRMNFPNFGPLVVEEKQGESSSEE